MKTKSHKLKWATALCSVAFFSSIGLAQAALLGDPEGDPKQPQTDEASTKPRLWWIDPITPAGGGDGEIESGTFSGTIVE